MPDMHCVQVDADALRSAFLLMDEGKDPHSLFFLLRLGADVDGIASQGPTFVLMMASKKGNLGAMRQLLRFGASVNMKDPEVQEGRNALMGAVEMNQKEAAVLLIGEGADVNWCSEDGKTPLILAASAGHKDLMELLLDSGADKNLADACGRDRTLLIIAADMRRTDVAEFFLSKGVDVNARDRKSLTPLMVASDKGFVEIVELLLNRRADLHAKTPDGRTAFMLAVSSRRTEVVSLLIARGANIHEMDKMRRTALYLAIEANQAEIVKILIDNGADVNAPSGFASSAPPLVHAATKGMAGAAEFLVKAGADINATDRDHRTALMLAVWYRHVDVVEALISLGARADLRDRGVVVNLVADTQRPFHSPHVFIIDIHYRTGRQLWRLPRKQVTWIL
uniref:Uncharacterized protein n=1 Tax=Chromera velia CCMP2878 TaxID=1169474 RepID=A0A0K6S7Z1_9ALVE|eukprot:Cvel_22971.t2-p1 / transcript=Cvel_22971.t2 / gene=Cvel_22971 / organism=Chromera_velia_CCMP2878 / gene_product=Ankyrin repeat domain-containing protein 50, putative / transcript_product=Ankyrin repeat domain-containing protein 50, putative / location=Cvel_scaffold2315:13896-20291(+) / protein_length=394 / sequence_SO=supercontig / SO=protein_coding / is_pseudo=false